MLIDNENEKLVTNKEAASILGISVRTLNNWRCSQAQKIAYVKVGRKVLYKLKDINTFINTNTFVY